MILPSIAELRATVTDARFSAAAAARRIAKRYKNKAKATTILDYSDQLRALNLDGKPDEVLLDSDLVETDHADADQTRVKDDVKPGTEVLRITWGKTVVSVTVAPTRTPNINVEWGVPWPDLADSDDS